MALICLFPLLFSVLSVGLTQGDSLSYLALGDSYTIGESVDPGDRYPVQLAGELTVNGIAISSPDIVATTGWTTLDLSEAMDVRQIEDNRYDLVSLLIGVNDQYQGKDIAAYPDNFRSLLKRSIALADGAVERVFVISIPDYAFTPFGQERDSAKISADIDAYNEINRKIAHEMGVRYFDITPISRLGLDEPALVAKDGLHPSGNMYQRWVEEIMLKPLLDLLR